jgi:DNA-binding transcriptional LysR family regulator
MNPATQKTIRRLIYFSAIAEAGSIRGAARELGLSAPVLSAALTELEAELGLSLAARSTRKFQLTSAGQNVLEHAQRMLSEVDAAMSLATTERHLHGHLGITLPIELTASWLPQRLARFQKEYPDIKVSVDASDEVQELRDSSIDIAIRARYTPFSDSDGKQEYLRLTCVAAQIPEYCDDGRKIQLDSAALISPGGNEWTGVTDPVTGTHKTLHATSLVRVSNRLSSLALASHGIGYTLVTESAARDFLDAGLLQRLFPDWDFGSITLRYVFRDDRPSAEARAFVQLLDSFAES